MLYGALLLALAAASGAEAQCVAQTNGVTYDFCGRVGPLNVYWTPMMDQTNFVFEGEDNAWYAFGFANEASPNAMPLANHIFGCDDFDLAAVQAAAGIPDLPPSPWDGVILDRDVPGVASGFNASNLAIDGSITLVRENGICGIRFERLNVLADPMDAVLPAQDIISGTPNIFVAATGAPDTPAIHTARVSGSQDFILGMGDITEAPVQPFCVAQTNNVTYDFCGRVGPLNVYWTPMEDQTNFVFEGVDNAWYAFGFANEASPEAMPGANHIFGCDDFDLAAVQAAAGIPDLPASPWDGVILGRTVEGVASGFNASNLAIEDSISLVRMNGICGIRFERLNVLADPMDAILPAQDIVMGTPNIFVAATGAPDTPALHTARVSGSQDFLEGMGDITDMPIVPISTMDVPDMPDMPDCVAQTNGVEYDFCGRTGPLNVYWTPLEDQTNIIFEGLDNAWYSFGFGSNPTPQAMINANHIFGCDNFDLAAVQAASGIPDLPASPWDAFIPDRTLAGVASGFNASNLAIEGTITQIRMNGLCGIRFERMNVLADPMDAIDAAQDILMGTPNVYVVATGAPDAPAVHTARTSGSQDFMLGMGDISDMPVVPLEAPGMTTTQPGNTMPADPDNSAALASLSPVLVGAVASLFVAMW